MRMISKVLACLLRNKFICLLLISLYSAVLSLFPAIVVAEESNTTAQELINRMSHAARDLNYDGTFIYRRGQQIDTMRLIHKIGKDGEIERLVSLTGSAREVIRNKNSVTCIFPDDKVVMVGKSRPRKLLSTILPEPIEKSVVEICWGQG